MARKPDAQEVKYVCIRLLKAEADDEEKETPVKIESSSHNPPRPWTKEELNKTMGEKAGIEYVKCKHCPFKSLKTRASNLKIHIENVHLNLRNHECGICGHRFSQKHSLIFHMKT